MKCLKCRRDNPPNSTKCVYCGTPIRASINNIPQLVKKEPKRIDNIIIAIVIMLVVALIIVSVLVFCKPKKSGNVFHGGNGGGVSMPSISRTTQPTTQPTAPSTTPTPAPTPISTPQVSSEQISEDEENQDDPENRPHEGEETNAASIREGFLKSAKDIEDYTESYLETAITQQELNRESAIVYNKWDNLLNEIYQYLEQTLYQDEFYTLKSDEERWIERKETAMREAEQEYEGGSMAALARNVTGIEYTTERCYYLISLIN